MVRFKLLDSLNTFLLYAPQLFGANPVSLFTLLLAFPQLLSNHYGGGSIHWMAVWGALIHTGRPEIADGCYISCWLIWQEIFSFHISKYVLGANYRLGRRGTGHKVPTSRREGVSLEQSPETGSLLCVEVGERRGNQGQRQLRRSEQ